MVSEAVERTAAEATMIFVSPAFAAVQRALINGVK